MFLRFIAAVLLCLTVTTSHADVLSNYYADIGPQDYRNSRGAVLTTVGAILQQDRANVHRFGIRHEFDDVDEVFASSAARANLPTLYARGRQYQDVTNAVLRGEMPRLWVWVCGSKGKISHLLVFFGDGDIPMSATDDC